MTSTAAPIERTPLTRARVVDAALELARAGGLEALSMRTLAVELGVSTMAAYRHVTGREDIERAIAARVLDEVMALHPTATGSWQQWVRLLADRSFDRISAVPGLAAVIRRETAPDLVAATWFEAFVAQAMRQPPEDSAAGQAQDVRARAFAQTVVWVILEAADAPASRRHRAAASLEDGLELLLDGYDR